MVLKIAGAPFLKGVGVLGSNEYQLMLAQRNKSNQTLMAFFKDTEQKITDSWFRITEL